MPLVVSKRTWANELATLQKPGTTNTSDSCHMDNNYSYETYNQPWVT